MPLYTFACEECGSTFELLRAIPSRDDTGSCTRCDSPRVHRKIDNIARQRISNSLAGAESVEGDSSASYDTTFIDCGVTGGAAGAVLKGGSHRFVRFRSKGSQDGIVASEDTKLSTKDCAFE